MRATVAFGLLALALYLFVAVVECSVSAAQKASILAAHNNERAKPKYTPAKKLPALKWSAAGAKKAQSWANKCKFAHSVPKGYGQNIASGTGYSPAALVGLWINEKSKFTDAKITNAVVNKCGHYTQLVWAKTTSVGCGIANCPGMGTYLVCNYHPAGNFIGKKPYTRKSKRDVEDAEDEEMVEYDMPEDFASLFEYQLEERNGCTPNATCDTEQSDCGTFWDGCENTNCGTCADPTTTCSDDQLGNCVTSSCEPTQTCASLGRTCGAIFNGCGSASCGDCATGYDCLQGKCVAAGCADACDQDQTCTNGQCVCKAGLQADANNTCSPIPLFPTDPNVVVTEWENNNGKWVPSTQLSDDAVDGLSHLAADQEDIILWTKSNVFPVAGKVSVSAVFTPNDTQAYGVIFRALNIHNYYSVEVRGNNVNFVVVRDGKQASSTILGAAALDEFGSIELRVVAYGQSFVVYANGAQTPAGKVITERTFTTVGKVGIFAQGAVDVSEVHTAPSKNIKLSVGTCANFDNLLSVLPGLLGVSANQITAARPPICNKKRDASIVGDVIFEVAGSNDASVDAVQTTLSSAADASTEATAESGALPIAAEDAGIEFLTESVVLEIAEAAASVAAAGIGAAAIAGIVVGGAAGTAALAGAAVVVHKKVRVQKRNTTSANDGATPGLEAIQKPKGAGANVFTFDPNSNQSITGRSPAQKV